MLSTRTFRAEESREMFKHKAYMWILFEKNVCFRALIKRAFRTLNNECDIGALFFGNFINECKVQIIDNIILLLQKFLRVFKKLKTLWDVTFSAI